MTNQKRQKGTLIAHQVCTYKDDNDFGMIEYYKSFEIDDTKEDELQYIKYQRYIFQPKQL